MNTNAAAGGGGLISTAVDMATWVAAHLGWVPPGASLGVQRMADTLRPVSDISKVCTYDSTTTPPTIDCHDAAFRMGLGWELYGPGDQGVGVDWAHKDGGTNGSATDTALAVAERTGVTTMFDQKAQGTDDDIASQILALLIASRTAPVDPALPASGGGQAALAASGTDAEGLLVPAVGAGVLLALGATLLAIRRRRGRENSVVRAVPHGR